MSSNTSTQPNKASIQAGLSTLIKVTIEGENVGAIQTLTTNETRTLERIQEVGTDGIIEIVPVAAAFIDLTVARLVFDRLRLPESFNKAFQHIQSQAAPFDIVVTHLKNYPNTSIVNRITTYENCWFTSYDSTYTQGAYLITENASLWAERAWNSGALPTDYFGHKLGVDAEGSVTTARGFEEQVNIGTEEGALDAAALFPDILT